MLFAAIGVWAWIEGEPAVAALLFAGVIFGLALCLIEYLSERSSHP